MILRAHTTVLSILLLCIGGVAIAQQPHYQEQTNYSPLTDIKQVTGIAADKNNCIWLATQAGVYRYDGSHFRHYTVLNTPVLKFERFSDIFPTISQKGYSWYMKDAKGNLYTADSMSRIIPFKADPGSKEMSLYNVFGYWDFTPEGKISRQTEFAGIPLASHFLPSARRLILLSGKGKVFSINIDDPHPSKKGDSLYVLGKNQENRTFATDKSFYLITSNNMLRWQGMNNKPSPVALSGDINLLNISLRYDSLQFYITTVPNVMLIGYKGCIYEATEMNNGGLNTRLLIRDASQKLPITVYYSPSQRIFLSYFAERGLVIYRPSRFSLLSGGGADGLPPSLDYYYSVLPDGDGLITVNSAGIIRFGLNGEKKLLLGGVYSRYFIFKDRSGNIWYENVHTRQIAYITPGEGKSIPVMRLEGTTAFCGAQQVNDSLYYILTSKKLYKIVRRAATGFFAEVVAANTTNGEEFHVLYAVSKDVLWLGNDQGLEEFNLLNETIKPVEALKKSYVRSMIRLEKDNYLVGTYDKGIFQYFDGHWTRLPSTKGRLPSSAHGFVIDSILQCIWVSSNDGLSRIPLNMLLRDGNTSNTKIGFINDFGPDISPEFNGSSNASATKLSDSCIAFANAKGLVVFNPLKLVNSPLPVRVLIESPEETADTSTSKKRNPNQLLFTPVVPYYGDAGDLEISYRLTGVDKEWHVLSGNPIISYNNVKPGDHELQFRISNFHSQDGSEQLLNSYPFFVPARWYQTTWLKVVVVVLGLIIIIVLHNIRIWYLKERKRFFEEQVKIKTSELRETNNKLSDAIKDLKLSEADLKQSNFLKDEYYAVLTHDLRSPLKFLSFNINKILELLPEMDSEKLKKNLVVTYDCTNDVYKLVDEFVYWIQNNEDLLEPRSLPTHISAVMTDIEKIYGFSLEGNKNELIKNIPHDLRFSTDPQMLFILLRNAIDNANKYTAGGTITVSAVRQDGYLKVAVADTGSGIKEETVQHLVSLQSQDVQFGYKKRKSLGFYIMAMLAKKLGGRYDLKSTPGKGSELSFIIPELKEEEKP